MIICGMLHNASLTFILWGAFHGIAIILAYKYTLPFRSTIKKVVFSASSIIPSILFASQSFQDLTILVKNAFIFDLVEIPILSIILYPHVAKPMTIPNPPIAKTQIGTFCLSAIELY